MNLLFDLDGTLADPREGLLGCLKHALVKLGHAVPSDAELEAHIGPPLRDTFRQLLPGNAGVDHIEAAIEAYRERYVTQGILENHLYKGVPAAIKRVAHSGARMFVATSKPWEYAKRIVEHFGLAGYFEHVYGSELDGTRADKTELIAHALRASRLGTADTVMIGDRRHDVIAAIRNGVHPVGVLWGYGTRAELEAAGARRLLSHPAELPTLAARHPLGEG